MLCEYSKNKLQLMRLNINKVSTFVINASLSFYGLSACKFANLRILMDFG